MSVAPPLFDSHCHLTAEAFHGEVDEVLGRAREAGVERVVTIASTAEDAAAGVALSRAHASVWTTAGYHPHEAAAAEAGWEGRVRDDGAEDCL